MEKLYVGLQLSNILLMEIFTENLRQLKHPFVASSQTVKERQFCCQGDILNLLAVTKLIHSIIVLASLLCSAQSLYKQVPLCPPLHPG